MTYFYRPVGPARSTRLSELWGRCDVCNFSGPYSAFNDYVHEGDTLTLCQQCTHAFSRELITSGRWRKAP